MRLSYNKCVDGDKKRSFSLFKESRREVKDGKGNEMKITPEQCARRIK